MHRMTCRQAVDAQGRHGTGASGQDYDDSYNGGHCFGVATHHSANIQRKNRADAGHGKVTEKLKENHEAHRRVGKEIFHILPYRAFLFLMRSDIWQQKQSAQTAYQGQ